MQISTYPVEGWRQKALFAAAVAISLAWSAVVAGSAIAQQADGEFEGDHTFKAPDGKVVPLVDPKALRSKIPGILRAGKTTTAKEEEQFAEYFRYQLAELTWKENVKTLPDLRKKLKNYLNQAGRGAAPDLHKRLNEWILKDFQQVAKDARYPRAVRLNAVLMIGELDRQEATIGGPPATPMPEAEPVLFGIFNDATEHDALRIEALVCLERHADGHLTGDQRTEMVAAMTKLLSTKDPPKGKSPVGHMWMRWIACQMISRLAAHGAEANQPQVVDALQTLVTEKSADLWLRCDAAGRLGSLQSNAFAAEKVMPLAQQLADLVVETAQTSDRLMEAAGLEDKKEKAPAKPALDEKEEGEEEAEESEPPAIPPNVLKLAAEEVADQLIRIRFGLTAEDLRERDSKPSTNHGLYAAGDQAGKTFIGDVVGRIDDMLKCLKDNKVQLHEQLANISSVGAEMQAWLKQSGAGVAPKAENVAEPAGNKPAPAAGAKPPAGSKSAAESAVSNP